VSLCFSAPLCHATSQKWIRENCEKVFNIIKPETQKRSAEDMDDDAEFTSERDQAMDLDSFKAYLDAAGVRMTTEDPVVLGGDFAEPSENVSLAVAKLSTTWGEMDGEDARYSQVDGKIIKQFTQIMLELNESHDKLGEIKMLS